ncbi:hypothetical protein [Leifsonia kafniensis]
MKFSRIRMPQGVTLILLATAIAGGCGYVANLLVGGTRLPADYVAFGIFWSALYLVIASLSGVQQEVTRATAPRTAGVSREHTTSIRRFGIWASLATAAALIASGPFWMGAVFPDDGWAFILPIAIGCASYVVVAVLCGTLYGLNLWPAIALMSSVDGILRLLLIGIVVLFDGGIDALVWAVVLPFPLTPLILWWFFRSSVVGRTSLDVGYRDLSWNVLRTVIASVATGILISGFPLVLKAMSPMASNAELGALVFAINLVRAPLVIVVLSLQSYFVVRFRDVPERAWGTFLKLSGAIVIVGAVGAVVAGLIVPPLLTLFPGGYALDGFVIAGLVATSALLGVLCLSGPLALARSQHGVFTAGWVVAAVASVLLLLVPGDLAGRMLFALAIGPLLGVATHLTGLFLAGRTSAQRHAPSTDSAMGDDSVSGGA